MIWALIMASDQWSSTTYLTAAGNMIQAMRQNSIGPDGLLKPGDTWGGTTLTDPSYFSPAYFRVFAVVSGDLVWARDIIDKNYAVLASVSGTNGLVPDWTTDSGVVNMGFLTNDRHVGRLIQQRLGQQPLRLRRRPHAVAHRHGLVLQQGAARAGLSDEGRRLLQPDGQQHRQHRRRLRAERLGEQPATTTWPSSARSGSPAWPASRR